MKEPLLQFLSTNGHKEQAEFNKASVNEGGECAEPELLEE